MQFRGWTPPLLHGCKEHTVTVQMVNLVLRHHGMPWSMTMQGTTGCMTWQLTPAGQLHHLLVLQNSAMQQRFSVGKTTSFSAFFLFSAPFICGFCHLHALHMLAKWFERCCWWHLSGVVRVFLAWPVQSQPCYFS